MFLAPEIPASYSRTTISDGEAGIFDTLTLMRRMVNDYKTDPGIRQAALNVTFMTPAQDDASEVEALYCFVRDYIRYTKDVYGVETLATPDKTMAMRVGDCDDQTVLLASLLESIGYPTRFVIEGYSDGGTWEHVYLETCLNGQWVALDPTEQVAMGWQPPEPVIRWTE
ncbi:MAG: transglutaminase domain-containing protein [Alphaproteobacteria bacterium]|nr:transglutaminase domain-containing protein [Alphaproteobacteria bacterium]